MQAGRELEKRDSVVDMAMCEATTPGPWSPKQMKMRDL